MRKVDLEGLAARTSSSPSRPSYAGDAWSFNLDGWMPACPICSSDIDSGLLEWHVNEHFRETADEKGSSGERGAWRLCKFPGCNFEVSSDDWESHQLAHQLARDEGTTGGGGARACANDEVVDLTDSPTFERQRGPPDLPREDTREGGITANDLRNVQVEDIQYKPAEGNVIPTLLQSAVTTQKAAHSVRAAICAAPVLHFESKRADSGWACGWRNIQILAAHLLGRPSSEFRPALFGGSGFVPDIESLQGWLEVAWNMGYDQEGRRQLGGRVVGTTRWIGATECAALLRSFGVRAQLVDFSAQKKRPRSPRLHRAHSGAQSTLSFAPSGSLSIAGPSPKRPRLDDAAGGAGGAGFGGSRAERPRAQEGRGWDGAGESTSGSGGGRGSGAASGAGLFGRDPESEEGSLLRKGTEEDHSKLVEWLWRYFTTDMDGKPLPVTLGQQVTRSAKPPLFFQHQGHSRTVVGVERRRLRWDSQEETFLLILDPSTRTGELTDKLRAGTGWQGLVKRGLSTLRGREYQIVAVQPGIAERGEREALKEMEFNHVEVRG